MISIKELSTHIRSNNTVKIFIFASIISLLLLFILFRLSDFDKLLKSFATIDIFYLIISFTIFLLSILVVSLRLLFILHLTSKKNFIASLEISIFHAALLCILPARIGDICYPFLLNKNLGVVMAHSVVNLLVLRLYDFLVSILLFLYSTIMLSINSVDKYFLQKTAVIFFIISICILGVMKYFSSIKISVLNCGDNNIKLNKIVDILQKMQEGFRLMGIFDHIILFSMTIIKWSLSILVIFYIFQSLNMNINVIETILISAGINLVVALPIQTIGGFGITETAMAFLLGLVGFMIDEAITYSLATRLIWFMMPIFIAVIWFLSRHLILRNALK